MFALDYEIKSAWIEFKIYDIEGSIDDDSLPDEKKYEVSEDPEIEGYLKWDGCCNWTANSHFCGFYGFKNFTAVMEELYKIKSKQWPHGD